MSSSSFFRAASSSCAGAGAPLAGGAGASAARAAGNDTKVASALATIKRYMWNSSARGRASVTGTAVSSGGYAPAGGD